MALGGRVVGRRMMSGGLQVDEGFSLGSGWKQDAGCMVGERGMLGGWWFVKDANQPGFIRAALCTRLRKRRSGQLRTRGI
jgi:hypothetical protein